MNLEQIKTFLAVVEYGGFHAASEHLYKSQPAVSKSIQQLEERMGCSLFDRSQYRPKLTLFGQTFYKHCKTFTFHWQKLQDLSLSKGQNTESTFTVALDTFFPLEEFTDLISVLTAKYPSTHFNFVSETMSGGCERLEQQQADITIGENLFSGTAIETIPLKLIKMISVASPDYRNLYQSQLDCVDTLGQCLQVILRDSARIKPLSFCVVDHAHHWSVNDMYSKREIIRSGMAWGRLPEYFIKEDLAAGKLVQLKADHFDTRHLQLCAIRLQKAYHGPVANALWGLLKNIRE